MRDQPKVIIIGTGFGGLEVARGLAGAHVRVLLLDRNNYQTFWPLMYQVATAALEPQAIAFPVRGVIRRMRNLLFRVVTVQQIDLARQLVVTDRGTLTYDELVVSAGSTNNFFGLQGIEQQGFGFKDLPEALVLRNHVIQCFERAATEMDAHERERLRTFIVVGGGPTGVELAGALAELVRHVIRRDFPRLDISAAKVLLVEMADRLLLAFPEELSRKAAQDLRELGVDVRLRTSVTGYQEGELRIKDGDVIPTRTVVWAAGVQASPLAKALGVPLQRGGRVPVTRSLHLEGYPNVWVIGDMAYLEDPDGQPYPQLATVAMQQGKLVSRNILRKQQGRALDPFQYIDKGSMATIGRRRAVAHIWGRNFSGPIAWLLWLAVHLLYLIGIRNRIMVLINWAYNYLTHDRGARATIAARPRDATQV